MIAGYSSLAQAAGTHSFPFLLVTPSPRAAALGESYVAVGEGAETVFYNPAGLGDHDSTHLYTHSLIPPLLEGMKYNSFVYSRPTQNGGWALHGGVFHIGGFKRTVADSSTADGFREESSFSTYDLILSFSAGKRVGETASIGSSLVYARESLSDVSASGFMADFGFLYGRPSSPARIGVSLQQVGPESQFQNSSWKPPILFRAGLSLRVPVQSSSHKTLASFEYHRPLQGDSSLRSGLEFSLSQRLAVRAGYRYSLKKQGLGSNLSLPNGFTFGLGLKSESWDLDYATVSQGELGLLHRISVDLKWSPPEKEIGERIRFKKRRRR
ncbi:MAG: PorV/PorQ family protein [Elusimicrobia bacterium]|nr:PorV/PorQ family protein [Elusimicrobiota bacterium]MBI4218107.1 PorV/PorQ family protein [Elusimicrobiota bacterium]